MFEEQEELKSELGKRRKIDVISFHAAKYHGGSNFI